MTSQNCESHSKTRDVDRSVRLSNDQRQWIEATHQSGQVGCNHAGGLGHCAVVSEVQEIVAAREQQVRAQTLREAANNLPAMTEGPLRVGTALWPSSDRDAYSLAIEEAQAALLARAEGEAGEGERRG